MLGRYEPVVAVTRHGDRYETRGWLETEASVPECRQKGEGILETRAISSIGSPLGFAPRAPSPNAASEKPPVPGLTRLGGEPHILASGHLREKGVTTERFRLHLLETP